MRSCKERDSPVPVTVRVKVPRGKMRTLTVRVELLPVAGLGLKTAVAPEGRPATDQEAVLQDSPCSGRRIACTRPTWPLASRTLIPRG
jgi:hypothetical protein